MDDRKHEEETLAQLKNWMKDPLYWREGDPVQVKKVEDGFRDLYDKPEDKAGIKP